MPAKRTTRNACTVAAACALIAGGLFYLSFLRGKTADASSAPDLLAALPPGAPTLVYLDLSALRASSFYQRRPDKGPLAVPNQDYADFVRATGFDFEKDLDRVVMASWPATGNESRKMVVIADGRFDRAKIHDYAAQKGKIDHQQGREVFLFPAGDKNGSDAVAFLDDHRIALVDGASLISLFAGHSDNLAGDPARERAARVDGAAAFVVTHMSPVPENVMPGGVQSAQLRKMVQSLQWVTLAVSPEGDDLRVSLEGECDNSADAAQLRSGLEVLRMFGGATLASPKIRQSMSAEGLAELQNLLTSAEVTQAEERVRIRVELTPGIFKLGENHKPQ